MTGFLLLAASPVTTLAPISLPLSLALGVLITKVSTVGFCALTIAAACFGIWVKRNSEHTADQSRAFAKVLNDGERVLFERLLSYTAGRPVMVMPKMRLIDVLHTKKVPGISPAERRYGYTAHFDFVLVDTPDDDVPGGRRTGRPGAREGRQNPAT